MNKQTISTRILAGSAMLTAVAVILQYLEMPIPFLMPPFIKFDLSDLPALIGAFAYGPLSGVIIELIKNLIHCLATKSATVGELSNLIKGGIKNGMGNSRYCSTTATADSMADPAMTRVEIF